MLKITLFLLCYCNFILGAQFSCPSNLSLRLKDCEENYSSILIEQEKFKLITSDQYKQIYSLARYAETLENKTKPNWLWAVTGFIVGAGITGLIMGIVIERQKK